MTLLLVNKTDLYNFQDIRDAEHWMESNPEITEITVMGEDEYDEEFQEFLDRHCPLEIM